MIEPSLPVSSRRAHVPLWRNVSFTLMWTSTAASGFGDRMIMFAGLVLLGGLVAGTQDSTAIQASTQFWFFLPYIFISFFGGWLADHLPRKWLLLGCDEARGLILLASYFLLAEATGTADIDRSLVWFTWDGFIVPQYWKVYLTLLLIGMFAATFNPTRNAIIPQIIPLRQLQPANAIILVINIVASLLGMWIGARLISQDHAQTVRHGLLLGAMFYLVSGLFFAFLRPINPHAAQGIRTRRSLMQAGRYAVRHRRVIKIIALNVLIWASAAAVTSGLMGIAKMHYGLEGDELLSAFARFNIFLGAGMLVGGALIVGMRTRRESPAFTMLAIAFAGICIFILAFVPLRPVTFAMAFGVGVAGYVVIITLTTLLQTITPNYMRGRIMGLNSMVNVIFSVATHLAIWLLPAADRSIVWVMLAMGPALVLVGLVGLARHITSGPHPTAALNLLWRLCRIYSLIWQRLRWVGRHHIPREGPVILASNHTTAIDPLLIQSACPRLVRWVMFHRHRSKLIEPLWRNIQPITLRGDRSDVGRIREMLGVLKQGDVIGLFPEGGLQRTHRELGAFQPGIAVLAQRSGAPIVPVWIAGTPRRHSMLMHFLHPGRCVVTFGEPFVADPAMSQEQVVEELRRRIMTLEQVAAQVR